MKRLFDINVNGVFFTAREAARHMIPQGGGSIILISSMSANVRFMSFVPMNRNVTRLFSSLDHQYSPGKNKITLL